jgi:hypothetical protein
MYEEADIFIGVAIYVNSTNTFMAKYKAFKLFLAVQSGVTVKSCGIWTLLQRLNKNFSSTNSVNHKGIAKHQSQ